MSYVEDAKRLRGIIEQASKSLSDSTALNALELFPAWTEGKEYEVDDRVKYKDFLFRCVEAHTASLENTPFDSISLWTKVDDPFAEWEEWKQPEGPQDAYLQDSKVSHNEKHWISSINANVYEPGVFGWAEAN